jgi:hypothetical protein
VKTHRCLGFGGPQTVLYTARDRIHALARWEPRPARPAGLAVVPAVHGASATRAGGDSLGERLPLGHHRAERDPRGILRRSISVRRRGVGPGRQQARDRPQPDHDHQATASAWGGQYCRDSRLDVAAWQGRRGPGTTGRTRHRLLRVVCAGGRGPGPPGGLASRPWAIRSPRTRSAPSMTGSTRRRSPAPTSTNGPTKSRGRVDCDGQAEWLALADPTSRRAGRVAFAV